MILIKIVIIQVSSMLVFYLVNRKEMNAVSASSLATIILILMLRMFNLGEYESLVYCSSFLGMTLIYRLTHTQLFVSGLVLFFMYSIIVAKVSGVGGTLGLIAFISSYSTFLLGKLYSKILKNSL